VIWVWVHDANDQLPPLQAAIERAMGSFGESRPDKEFTGHVTLGRCHNIKRPEAEMLSGVALGMISRVFGEWTAMSVELIRSEPSPAGSRYTIIHSIPLAGGHGLV
jgi:2'-5' RNA ligase